MKKYIKSNEEFNVAFVVTDNDDNIIDVFSTYEEAVDYVERHPYDHMIITREESDPDGETFGEEVVYESTPREDNEDRYTRYAKLAGKSVQDSDGFYTDYTLYKDRVTGLYFCMFGDEDLYEPDPDYADYETESKEAAYEWFENYNGFDEEDDVDSDDYLNDNW